MPVRLFLLLCLLLGFAAPARAAPAKDWTRMVTQTADGAFVLGDPKAPRLIEYVSYTCSHCAHFLAEASGPLRSGWVRRGLLSIEVRNAIRDPYDLTAAILARCGGKARFFGDHEAIFASHAAWMARVTTHDTARGDGAGKAQGEILADMAAGTGLSDLLVKRGLPLARQKQCLADKAAPLRLAGMANEAWQERKIGGTPSFVLNGALIDDVHDWASLRPRLPALPK